MPKPKLIEGPQACEHRRIAGFIAEVCGSFQRHETMMGISNAGGGRAPPAAIDGQDRNVHHVCAVRIHRLMWPAKTGQAGLSMAFRRSFLGWFGPGHLPEGQLFCGIYDRAAEGQNRQINAPTKR